MLKRSREGTTRGAVGRESVLRPSSVPARAAPTAARFAALTAALLAAVPGLALAGCDAPPARPDARALALEREREVLQRYLEAPEDRLVPFDDVLVVVGEEVLSEVLRAALPHRATVGDRYRLDLAQAQVDFRDGLALVELEGRAALLARPDVYADLVVVGVFRVLDLDPRRSTLRGRVEVLGFETREVGVAGLSPPVERLVDGLAAERAAELNEILGALEIPVLLEQEIRLPSVQEAEVTIPGGALPLRLEVTEVRVLAGRLWISLAAGIGAGEGA